MTGVQTCALPIYQLGSGANLGYIAIWSSRTKVRVYDLTSGGRLTFSRMTRVTEFDVDKRHVSTISGLPIDMSFVSCMNCLLFFSAMRIEWVNFSLFGVSLQGFVSIKTRRMYSSYKGVFRDSKKIQKTETWDLHAFCRSNDIPNALKAAVENTGALSSHHWANDRYIASVSGP